MKHLYRLIPLILVLVLLTGLFSGCSDAAKPAAVTTAADPAAVSRTAAPATSEPTTAAPATSEPTTAAPATSEPTTAAPATSEPTTAEPTASEPATSAPTAESPTIETSAPETHFAEVPERFYEFSYEGITLLIPEWFRSLQHFDFMVYLVDFLRFEGDTIEFSKIYNNILDLNDLSEEKLKESIKQIFGKTAVSEMTTLSYSHKTIEGGELVVYRFCYDYAEVGTVTYTFCYVVFDGDGISVVYREASDRYTERFQTSIDSICITGLGFTGPD